MEQWKDIPGYEGLYKVSSIGRVWNVKRNCLHGTRKRKKQVINGRLHLEYVTTWLQKGDTRKYASVHLLMLLAFKGPKPSPAHVCRHLNDIPYDNRIENIEWGTSAENNQEAYDKGRRVGSTVAGERGGEAARKILGKKTAFVNTITGEEKIFNSARQGYKTLGLKVGSFGRYVNKEVPLNNYLIKYV